MKERQALLIGVIGLFIIIASRGEDAFVDNLNAAWNSRNYPACLTNINQRLSTNTNDLPALVAKVCYKVFVEADYESAANIFQTTDLLMGGLSGTNATAITSLYMGLRDDIKACLSVPMTNAPPEEQKQYVRDALYPTNYPEHVLIRFLEQ